MSEYQFVQFLAIDRPLNDEQLEFMRQQSTRAEITPREFTNEYHFGDFHGNSPEMLRQGYDVHLHYANFGIRRLMIRLPGGLPCDQRTFDAYQVDNGLAWHKDKRGKGGILWIEPEADAGTYEELYDVNTLLHEIAPIREMLIGGDLRPLYLAWLACAGEDDSPEPPVPAGLDKLTPALDAMAEFYEVSEDLIAAAAKQSPPLPKTADASETLKGWVSKQSKDDLQSLVGRLLGADAARARAEVLSRIRDEMGVPAWAMAEPTRTLGELRQSAAQVGERRTRREQQAHEAKRRKRLAAIAADPQTTIANVEKLVKVHAVANYEQAARELAELREALGPERGPIEARDVAERLRRENPRLNRLGAILRKHGLLG
jgi:hypothetical protein